MFFLLQNLKLTGPPLSIGRAQTYNRTSFVYLDVWHEMAIFISQKQVIRDQVKEMELLLFSVKC